jgi:hypothetical protein
MVRAIAGATGSASGELPPMGNALEKLAAKLNGQKFG